MESPFLLLSVREGREDFAKDEISRRFLGAKFSFSRPGFLSFKAGKATETSGGGASWRFVDLENLIFPLRTSLFAGKVSGKITEKIIEEERERASGSNESVRIVFSTSQIAESIPACVHLHCIDYLEANARDDEPARTATLEIWERELPGLMAASSEILARAGNPKRMNAEAKTGEAILQMYRVGPREFWFGVSILRAAEFGMPAGESGCSLPDTAPSRAYLKVEEAIRLLERAAGGAIFRKGDRAIEVGCAPGGACYSLLKRGLRVLGIDRGEMAPIVAGNPDFSQVFTSVGSWVFPTDLAAEWFLVDMNAEPTVAVRETRAVMGKIAPGLKGVFLTLKLNREQYAVSGERLGRTLARELRLKTYFLKQLPSHHQEFALFGIR